METIQHILEHPIISLLPKPILGMLAIYIAFKVLDFITGLLKTWKGVVQYRSHIMRDGVIRWIGELVAISFVLILDLALGLNFYLTGFVMGLFIYKEGGSIAENLATLGIKLPGVVNNALEHYNSEGKDDKGVK